MGEGAGGSAQQSSKASEAESDYPIQLCFEATDPTATRRPARKITLILTESYFPSALVGKLYGGDSELLQKESCAARAGRVAFGVHRWQSVEEQEEEGR